ncbi:Flp pilus assembly pilin Flp [Brevibacterium pityocampae]
MNQLNRMAHQIDVNARVFAQSVREKLNDRESGQGTIEYIGIIVVITIIIAALVALFNGGIKSSVESGLQGIVDGIFGDSAY